MSNTIGNVKQINPTIVHGERVDNFERQLINLRYGLFNMNYPMVISIDTNCLNYISEIENNKLLVINPQKVMAIESAHNIGTAFVMNIYEMLENSLFCMDSLTHESSKVIVLNEYDERDGSPILAILRFDARRSEIDINQITSIYGKEHFNNLVLRSWNQNKKFQINTNIPKNLLNEKIEQLFRHTRLQLPNYLNIALSNSYSKQSFTKSQVEEDLSTASIVVDENEEYKLLRCLEDVYELRDMDDNYITYTYFDNLDEALEELQKQNDLSI